METGAFMLGIVTGLAVIVAVESILTQTEGGEA